MNNSSLLIRRACEAGFLAIIVAACVWAVNSSTGDVDDIVMIVLLCAAAAAASQLWPTLDYRLRDKPMAPLIAFVGCDGSGKSTLTRDLKTTIGASRAATTCYLGLGTGDMGERIKRWPLVGRAVERKLAKKARQTRTQGQKIPGVATALVIYLLSLGRLRRFKKMLRLRRAGVTVLTDRYPQVEIPGFYDGPGLSAAAPDSRLVAAIARQERRLYDYMAAFRPDIVVRLNIDAATAIARKPEHRLELVQRKVAVTPLLRFAGAPIVDLDALQPYPQVLAAASRIADGVIDRKTLVTRGEVLGH